jgi:hypothetical protein
MIRGDAEEIPATPKEIIDWIYPIETIENFDTMYMKGSGKTLESFDQDHCVQRACYKRKE